MFQSAVPRDFSSIAAPDAIAPSGLTPDTAHPLQLPNYASSAVREVAFVDGGLSDAQTLINGLKPGTAVYVLDPTGNELGQITQVLAGYHDLAAVSLFSHGSDGALQLGSTSLNTANLINYAGLLQSWSNALSADADLLLYGCDVAADATGQSFVQQIAALTGADVAASTDLTGSSALGGNWTLEFSTGSIEATAGSAALWQQSYQGVLNTLVEDTSITLPGIDTSSVAWGDYTGDGKLDLIITGRSPSASSGTGKVTKLYKNNGSGGLVEDTSITLPQVAVGSVAWGDYTGDGKLDLIITGDLNSGNNITKLYKNNGSGGLVEDTSNTLPGVSISSVAWGDYTGDGKLDLILTGAGGSGTISKLYKNNGSGGLVEDTSITLPGVRNGSVAWGDYTGDGKLDLILTGYQGFGTPITKLYKNNGSGGLVEDTSITLPGVDNSSLAWGDYTGDGKLDLILTGAPISFSRISKLYKNDGSGGLVEDTSIALPVVSDSSVAWGDYTGDGKLDLILTGATGSSIISKLYKNDGSGGLVEDTSIALPGVREGSVAWGDYTGDGKLDLILTGNTSGGLIPVSKLYRGVSQPVVTLPGTAPSYTENAAPLIIDASATVTDSSNFNTGNLTVRFSANGTADDRLAFRNQGTGTGQIGVSGNTITFGGTSIGTFTGGTGTASLVVTFNANATAAAATALLQNLTYANVSDNPATTPRTVEVVLTDGEGGTSAPVTETVNVIAVNDAPAGTDKTVTTLEDNPYTFTTADFGFSDPNDASANSLLAVKITTLPSAGTLTNNGIAVTTGQLISASNITSGLLKFTPAANSTSSNSFTFQVQDNGGTDNGGVDLDATPNTFTVNITPVNDAPAGTDKTITTNTSYTFTVADFGFTDPNDAPAANSLQAVIISSLPTIGRLTLNGANVTVGQSVSVAALNAGQLRYAAPTFTTIPTTPPAPATFTFRVQDTGGTDNGGIDTDPTPNTLTIKFGLNLNGGNGIDTIQGAAGNDTLRGGNGDDILFGNDGDDALFGDNGDDRLRGGLGNDTLTGGLGSDTFILAIGEGTDTITDFKVGTDKIGLTGGLTRSQLTIDVVGGRTRIRVKTMTNDGEILAWLDNVTTPLTDSDFTVV